MEKIKSISSPKEIRNLLWLLKLGALINVIYFFNSLEIVSIPQLKIPAQIFFVISAFRCLFPVSYPRNIVFHDSILSSVFLTRLLATFSEIAMIYQLSVLMRLLNTEGLVMINTLSWIIVIQVCVSQVFVWAAIIFKHRILYFYEEIGWFIIYSINTGVSLFILLNTTGSTGGDLLLYLNIIFGAGYLPWQFFHLKFLLKDGYNQRNENLPQPIISWSEFLNGIQNSITVMHPSTHSGDWGGIIGITWMFGYWAIIMPGWIYLIMKWG
ncbi:MAG: hypothetical protein QGF36_01220 [Candidatus Marinimicrobia bacterium]|nr:hypothetical protein [Candidatus Neomarinimicrobiota bacterium]